MIAAVSDSLAARIVILVLVSLVLVQGLVAAAMLTPMRGDHMPCDFVPD